jgi:hypothetical protein
LDHRLRCGFFFAGYGEEEKGKWKHCVDAPDQPQAPCVSLGFLPSTKIAPS